MPSVAIDSNFECLSAQLTVHRYGTADGFHTAIRIADFRSSILIAAAVAIGISLASPLPLRLCPVFNVFRETLVVALCVPACSLLLSLSNYLETSTTTLLALFSLCNLREPPTPSKRALAPHWINIILRRTAYTAGCCVLSLSSSRRIGSAHGECVFMDFLLKESRSHLRPTSGAREQNHTIYRNNNNNLFLEPIEPLVRHRDTRKGIQTSAVAELLPSCSVLCVRRTVLYR